MTAGSRFIIILFSLALVVLGLQPLNKHYNGLSASISKYSEKIFGKSLNFSNFRLPSQISIEVGKPNGESLSSRLERTQEESSQVKAFDDLKPEDRNALDKLLENLDK